MPDIPNPSRCDKCNALELLDSLRSAFAQYQQGSFPPNTRISGIRLCAACVLNLDAVYGAFFKMIATEAAQISNRSN